MKRIFTLFISLTFFSWISQAQPTNIVISPVSGTTPSIRVDWTSSTTCLIIIRKGDNSGTVGNSSYAPSDGFPPATSLVFPSANAQPTDVDNTVEVAAAIASGSIITSGTITGLSQNEIYTVQVYEYTGSGVSTVYKTAADAGISVRQASDGGYVLLGRSRIAALNTVVLIKTDQNGEVD